MVVAERAEVLHRLALPSLLLLAACTNVASTEEPGPDAGEDEEPGLEPDAGDSEFTPSPKPDEWPLTYDADRLLEDDQIFGG